MRVDFYVFSAPRKAALTTVLFKSIEWPSDVPKKGTVMVVTRNNGNGIVSGVVRDVRNTQDGVLVVLEADASADNLCERLQAEGWQEVSDFVP